jgi:CRP-like cAMP-binding protein
MSKKSIHLRETDGFFERRAIWRLTQHLGLTKEEKTKLQSLMGNQHLVPAENAIFEEGSNYRHAVILLNGWAQRYKLLDDGRKQIFNFVLPGQITGMTHALGKESAHTIETLTACRISTLDVNALLDQTSHEPRLALCLIWDEMREIALLQEHMVNLGRRSALEALTHVMLEIQRRLRTIGEANSCFEIPVTQGHLADLLGLSEVHVSRTLKKLREQNIIDIAGGKVIINLQAEAEDLAEFSQGYMD